MLTLQTASAYRRANAYADSILCNAATLPMRSPNPGHRLYKSEILSFTKNSSTQLRKYENTWENHIVTGSNWESQLCKQCWFSWRQTLKQHDSSPWFTKNWRTKKNLQKHTNQHCHRKRKKKKKTGSSAQTVPAYHLSARPLVGHRHCHRVPPFSTDEAACHVDVLYVLRVSESEVLHVCVHFFSPRVRKQRSVKV